MGRAVFNIATKKSDFRFNATFLKKSGRLAFLVSFLVFAFFSFQSKRGEASAINQSGLYSFHPSVVLSNPGVDPGFCFNHNQCPIESEPNPNKTSDNDEKEEDFKDELQKQITLQINYLSGILEQKCIIRPFVTAGTATEKVSLVILFHSWKTHLC